MVVGLGNAQTRRNHSTTPAQHRKTTSSTSDPALRPNALRPLGESISSTCYDTIRLLQADDLIGYVFGNRTMIFPPKV